MTERREFARWKCLIPCSCSDEDSSFSGQVVDMSFGGVCVVAGTHHPVEGTRLKLDFGEGRSLEGQVVYRRLQGDHPKHRDHFGLVFLEPWASRVKILKPFLEQCCDLQN